MSSASPEQTQIVISPKVHIPLEGHTAGIQQAESRLIQTNIPMAWTQDGMDFRLDITLPIQSELEIWFPVEVQILHINGEMIWKKSEERTDPFDSRFFQVYSQDPSRLHLVCNSGGALHILATFKRKANQCEVK